MFRKTITAFLDPQNAEDNHLLAAAVGLAVISLTIYVATRFLTNS